MNHSFNIDIAQKYGIEEAIIIENLQYWILQNQANNTNFHDGYYWTFNSSEAFAKLFPYMSAQKIKRILKKLEDKNVLKTGNYNKAKYDRTKWYAIIDEWVISCYKLPNPTTEAIVQNCTMDSSKMNNGLFKNVPPIPDINPDINPNEKPTTSHEDGMASHNDNICFVIMMSYEHIFKEKHRAVSKSYDWEILQKFTRDELRDAMIEYMSNTKDKSKCTVDYIHSIQARWRGGNDS